MSDDFQHESVCSSDAVSATLEELQYTLGEGPCIDAHATSRPVLEKDLAQPDGPRWFAYTPPALEAGARAVFGFPMMIGAIRIGALSLYRDAPGALSDEQYANALIMSGVAAREVLAMQSNAPPDALAHELVAGTEFRLVFHQATGMVAAQLGVRITEAVIRLRAHAFVNDRRLTDVAADVVERRLRFSR